MKLKMLTIISIAVLSAAGMIGCVGENPLPYITGAVTVADAADWADLAVGVFYASEVATDDNYYGDFETDYESSTSDYIYRATYSKNNDGSTMYLFAPEASAVTSVSQTSGVNGTFRVDFDSAASTSGYFYALAWIDDNSNGLLDLIDDSNDADQVAGSEFNRCPVYDDGGYAAFQFTNEGDSGYKFQGYDGVTNYYEYLGDVNQAAFSFDMTPALSGW